MGPTKQTLTAFVDDIEQTMRGDLHTLIANFKLFVGELLARFAANGMVVSLSRAGKGGNTVFLTSSPEAQAALTPHMLALGIPWVAAAPWLGVDYALGQPLKASDKTSKHHKRRQQLQKRMPKLRALAKRKGGAKKVYTQGFMPSLIYGRSSSHLPAGSRKTYRRVRP